MQILGLVAHMPSCSEASHRVPDGWRARHLRNLLMATMTAGSNMTRAAPLPAQACAPWIRSPRLVRRAPPTRCSRHPRSRRVRWASMCPTCPEAAERVHGIRRLSRVRARARHRADLYLPTHAQPIDHAVEGDRDAALALQLSLDSGWQPTCGSSAMAGSSTDVFCLPSGSAEDEDAAAALACQLEEEDSTCCGKRRCGALVNVRALAIQGR